MRTTFITSLFILPILSCTSSNASITGEWVEPLSVGATGTVHGFKLCEDGSASSINMPTLVWKRWMRIGNDLIMTGESVGNGQTFEFSDTMRIDRLNADSLMLIGHDGHTIGFKRAR